MSCPEEIPPRVPPAWFFVLTMLTWFGFGFGSGLRFGSGLGLGSGSGSGSGLGSGLVRVGDAHGVALLGGGEWVVVGRAAHRGAAEARAELEALGGGLG